MVLLFFYIFLCFCSSLKCQTFCYSSLCKKKHYHVAHLVQRRNRALQFNITTVLRLVLARGHNKSIVDMKIDVSRGGLPGTKPKTFLGALPPAPPWHSKSYLEIKYSMEKTVGAQSALVVSFVLTSRKYLLLP